MTRAVRCDAQHVIVTSGSQQAFDLRFACSSLARALGARVILSPASAGTHVLGRFGGRLGSRDAGLAGRVSSLAAEDGLVVFPLSRYCLTPPASDALVLGFGGLSPSRIAIGADKLAAIIRRAA